MTKLNSGKISILGVAAGLVAVSVLLGKALTTSVSATQPTPTPNCGTFEYTFNNEGSNSRVNVNVHNSDEQVDVTGLDGWSVSNLWLDEDGGGTNYISY